MRVTGSKCELSTRKAIATGNATLETSTPDWKGWDSSHLPWTLQAAILPENTASLAIHKKCGFREVGRRERLGKLHGKWRDVVLLERRSQSVGVE
jgi:hypothetical protein